MNVLSLFDGMSCGRIALERACIQVSNYFASEIDKHAIKVSQNNWKDVTVIGDVTKISFSNGVLYTEVGQFQVGKVDLVIAGSPCQGFSMAGKQLAFDDERSKLYFVFERILKEIQAENPSVKFLLENVKMKQEYKDIISERLGVTPVAINSNLVSAQNRYRLYWANFQINAPADKYISLSDVIGEDARGAAKRNQVTKNGVLPFLNIRKDDKSNCVVSSFSSKLNGCITNGEFRGLTPEECEELQTVPIGYTSSVSDSQRYKMLGNGWTVDVIASIFKNLK